MPNSIDESDIADLYKELTETEAFEKPRAMWLKWLKRFVVAAVVLLGLAVVAILVLLELAKVEPEFYQQALKVDAQLQKRNGSQMEKKILDLRNSVMIAEAWSTTFTEAQINGWLAYDLKEKFPDALPPEVTDPRIVIEDQSLTLAFRCTEKPFRGVAIVEADVFMTGVINQIGIRVKSVHTGMIPVPLAAIADQIAQQLKSTGIEIEWNTEEDDPVAIVHIPDELIKPETGGYIELQEINVLKGKFSIQGLTHPPDF